MGDDLSHREEGEEKINLYSDRRLTTQEHRFILTLRCRCEPVAQQGTSAALLKPKIIFLEHTLTELLARTEKAPPPHGDVQGPGFFCGDTTTTNVTQPPYAVNYRGSRDEKSVQRWKFVFLRRFDVKRVESAVC